MEKEQNGAVGEGDASPPHMTAYDRQPIVLPSPSKEPAASVSGIPPEVLGSPPPPPEVVGTPPPKKRGRKQNVPQKAVGSSNLPEHLTAIVTPLPPEALMATPPAAAVASPTPAAASVPEKKAPKGPLQRGSKGGLNHLGMNPGQPDQWFNLPDDWRKQIVTRKSGNTAGGYDVYVYPPVGKKLRSNNDILRWVQANPTVPIDPTWVNMSVPLNQTGEVKYDNKIEELVDKVQSVKSTGELPNTGMFKNACQPTTKANVTADGTPKPPKAKKAKPASPPKFQLSPAHAMQLELYYLNSAAMPSQKQMKQWSADMGLVLKDVKAWFKAKWQARLETEARLKTLALMTAAAKAAFHAKNAAANGNGNDVVFEGQTMGVPLILPTRRPINPDVFSTSTGDLSSPTYHNASDGDQNFVIEYDNEPEEMLYAAPGVAGAPAPDSDPPEHPSDDGDDDGEICIDDFLSTELQGSDHEISL